MNTVRLGIIGGGLMGREVASAIGRWFALEDCPRPPELVAVCDLQDTLLDWFRKVPTVRQLTRDYRELLANTDVDVVYVAVPHHLHESIYLDVLRAGKDLLAEKPFGIDRRAAQAIRDEGERMRRFVRCSSEFPFLPGPQRVVEAARSGRLGKLLEIRAGFLHSSDLDPEKPINWKRQVQSCGEIGVMGDLGLHVVHIPFRLGWYPQSVYAQLANIVTERPDGKGGMAPCDTWDNAILHTSVVVEDRPVPMTLEMKRMAPGETNSWFIEVAGMEGAVRYSTKEPKTLWSFRRDGEQWWQKTDLGFQTPFKTITGGIFEPGFPDVIQQMLAAFVAEREGLLGERFGCVTPDEAVASHALFAAALESQRSRRWFGLDESRERSGVIAGGNWIVDHVRIIDAYPEQDGLAHIIGQSVSNGGSPYNLLKDLARLEAPFPLAGAGLTGADEEGRFILEDCRAHGIDVSRLRPTAAAATAYTDVMTVKSTGRRTFFYQAGTNGLLDHDDLAPNGSNARIFHLGYLLLLDRLDEIGPDGQTEAARLLRTAQSLGFRTSADVVSEDSGRVRAVVDPCLPAIDYFFLNEAEAERITGTSTRRNESVDWDGVSDAAKVLIDRGVNEVACIHCPEGALARTISGREHRQASVDLPPEKIAGAVGAGDAFAAGMLLGLHEGWQLERSLQLGVCAAASSLLHPASSTGVLPWKECLKLGEVFGFRESGVR